MLSIKLAFKNLMGAGLRTWLNIAVLSIVYVMIIFMVSLLKGVFSQIEFDTIKSEYAGGQYWCQEYDPGDPFSLSDAHRSYSDLQSLLTDDNSAAVLISSATIYANGRMHNGMMKGIDPKQTILEFESSALVSQNNFIPAMVGKQMARSTDLKKGDIVTLQFKDAQDVIDAVDVEIVKITDNYIQTMDLGQIWIPLKDMQRIKNMPDQATMITVSKEFKNGLPGWNFKDLDYLLADIRTLAFQKQSGSAMMFVIMLFLAAIAIFDTQMLAIFRRKKEIGTLIALGMTRKRVMRLFTMEGVYYSILGIGIGLIYGLPIVWFTSTKGINYGDVAESMGMNMGNIIYSDFSFSLIFWTTLVVALIVIFVSYLPARQISKLNPATVLKGK